MPLYRYRYLNKVSDTTELDLIVYKKEDKNYFNKNDIKKVKKITPGWDWLLHRGVRDISLDFPWMKCDKLEESKLSRILYD